MFPVVLFTSVALLGMAWLTLVAQRKDARWRTAPSPKPRRRRPPPVVAPGSNGSNVGRRARAAGGIRYRE
jgi:hypothetical protein